MQRQRMRRHHVDAFGNLDALGFGIDQKCRKPLGARRLAGAGEDDIDIGNAAIGNIGLLAIENETALHARGRHSSGGGIGAGFRFGDGEGGDGFALPGFRKPCLLLRRSEQRDRPHAEALHGESRIRQGHHVGRWFRG